MTNYTDVPTADKLRQDMSAGQITLGHHRSAKKQQVTLGQHRSAKNQQATLGQHQSTTNQQDQQDRVLAMIFKFLEDYTGATKRVTIGRHRDPDILWQLYSMTGIWLKRSAPDQAGRRAIEALSRVVDRKLCGIFGCAQHTLHQELKNYYGKSLDEGMGKGDEALLDPDERRDRKIVFRNGLAYRRKWQTQPKSLFLIKANTLDIRKDDGEIPDAITPGAAGYILGFGYSLYVGLHLESSENYGFPLTHMQYKGRKPRENRQVLCAGEIFIVDGKIRYVTNSSGHYKPTHMPMLHLARCLMMNGVDLSRVRFRIRTHDSDNMYHAKGFYAHGGRLASLTPITDNEKVEFLRSLPGLVQGLISRGTSETLVDTTLRHH